MQWQIDTDCLAHTSDHLRSERARRTREEKVAEDESLSRPFVPPPDYINPITPERDRADRHTMMSNGVTYHLYWGDYHRHTDISNCVTANDGCVLEQFRYALDMGKLDTLGTSDHTDIAKVYHPYEWWLNQKMVDVFYTPGFFMSMYAYERESRSFKVIDREVAEKLVARLAARAR